MKVIRILGACIVVVALVGVAGCTAIGVEGQALKGPGTPTASKMTLASLPEITGVHPADGSQACPRSQIGVDLILTDALRRDGTFDRSTVALTLDGNDVTQAADVQGSMDYPQSRASLLYTPATSLTLGTHRATFSYPAVTGQKMYEWTFTVVDMACPPPSGGGVTQPQTPGVIVPGQPPTNRTPTSPSQWSEIARVLPVGGSQTCLSPQIGVDLLLTDAMRRNGTFDRSTVALAIDGKDVTQQAQVSGSQDNPQSRASLAYTPPSPLASGTHRATFTYPAAAGRKTYEWTFMVTNNACAPSGDDVVGRDQTTGTPGAAEAVRLHPTNGTQACPRPQIGVDLPLTDAMRRNGAFDPSTVNLTLDGNDVTQNAKVLGTMTFPQSQVSLLYTPTTPLAVGTHQVTFSYPAPGGRKTSEWTFTVANIPCP